MSETWVLHPNQSRRLGGETWEHTRKGPCSVYMIATCTVVSEKTSHSPGTVRLALAGIGRNLGLESGMKK
jgi:hypothetical protein